MNQWLDSDTNKTDPLEDGKRWVRAIAHIRKNSTGEVRLYNTSEILDAGENYPSAYMWEEGNFSCDCNREIFFEEVVGKEATEFPGCQDGHYSVNLENPATGELYYVEYEPDAS